MTDDDKKKAEAILRKRRLAAEGLLDKAESKDSDPIAEERAEGDAVRSAVAVTALHRSG